MMTDLLKSASKIVFLLMAGATVAALFVGKIEAKDFMLLTSAAFTFYFSSKGDVSQPYAGK
jgi:hypothetical protein